MNDTLRQTLKTVPARPGCYIMRDRRGEIIYVGKAVNLRRRVLSYFRPGARHPPKVASMVHCVEDLSFLTVRNDAEALLTEASLIKKYKPRFNILMRDDKRYLALRADPSAEFPRLSECRIVRDDGAVYFGPFPSAPVVRAVRDFAEKRFGLRSCKAERPSPEDHTHCLSDVIRHCSAPCLGCVTPQEYAARFAEACAFLRGERPAVLEEVAKRMKDAAAAGGYEEAARWRDTLGALNDLIKSRARVRKTPGIKRAEAEAGLRELAGAVGLAEPPRIIECVDISNLFGTHSVASMVVAVDGVPDRRKYRRFKIKTVEGADDPRSMAEVVVRRYSPGGELSAKNPDASLFICDGGVTQLRAARRALAAVGRADIPTCGLAKRMEEIVLDDGRPPVLLPRDSPALAIITRLRDEAHRFAITYHRTLRERTIRESVLDDVDGIGPAKKAALLRKFGSVRRIAAAAPEDVASAAGIGMETARAVLRAAASAAGEKSFA